MSFRPGSRSGPPAESSTSSGIRRRRDRGGRSHVDLHNRPEALRSRGSLPPLYQTVRGAGGRGCSCKPARPPSRAGTGTGAIQRASKEGAYRRRCRSRPTAAAGRRRGRRTGRARCLLARPVLRSGPARAARRRSAGDGSPGPEHGSFPGYPERVGLWPARSGLRRRPYPRPSTPPCRGQAMFGTRGNLDEWGGPGGDPLVEFRGGRFGQTGGPCRRSVCMRAHPGSGPGSSRVSFRRFSRCALSVEGGCLVECGCQRDHRRVSRRAGGSPGGVE